MLSVNRIFQISKHTKAWLWSSLIAWPPVNCASVPQLFQQLINNTLFLRKFVCRHLCCVPVQIQTFFYQNLVLVAEYHVGC